MEKKEKEKKSKYNREQRETFKNITHYLRE
jgi:hypothetical protein